MLVYERASNPEDLVHLLQKFPSDHNMVFFLFGVDSFRCKNNRIELPRQEVPDQDSAYFVVHSLLLLRINLTRWFLQFFQDGKRLPIDIVIEFIFDQDLIQIETFHRANLFDSQFLDDLANNFFRFTLLLEEWNHLMHDIGNDVSVCILRSASFLLHIWHVGPEFLFIFFSLLIFRGGIILFVFFRMDWKREIFNSDFFILNVFSE